MWAVHVDFDFLQGHRADTVTEETGGVIVSFVLCFLSDITPHKHQRDWEAHNSLSSLYKQMVEDLQRDLSGP